MADRPARADAGFILLDAVLAAGLLAFAGTVIIMIANTMLTQAERELDRSVALVGAQSLIKQYLLLGSASAARLEREDELFVYSFEPYPEPVAGTTACELRPRNPTARSSRLLPNRARAFPQMRRSRTRRP